MLKVEDVIEFYHEKPKHKKYICPFHNDKVPSLSVNYNRQIFKCFVCEVGGDLITFTAKLFNLSNLDACKKLNDDFRLNLINETLSRKQIINAKRVQTKINKAKQIKEEAENNYIKWVMEFARFDRICIDNNPKFPSEPSNFWLVCNEMKLMCWDKIQECEVLLWKLKN